MNIMRADGKIVGKVENGVFKKSISGSIHFLRNPPAIANDLAVLKQAKAEGATHVEITDRETGKQYVASLDLIWKHGKVFDRGYGEQIFLPMCRWNQEKPENQPSLF